MEVPQAVFPIAGWVNVGILNPFWLLASVGHHSKDIVVPL
jgi:hypothetical protein